MAFQSFGIQDAHRYWFSSKIVEVYQFCFNFFNFLAAYLVHVRLVIILASKSSSTWSFCFLSENLRIFPLYIYCFGINWKMGGGACLFMYIVKNLNPAYSYKCFIEFRSVWPRLDSSQRRSLISLSNHPPPKLLRHFKAS